MSGCVREGPVVDECERLLGWRPDMVTFNKNVQCMPHRDRNTGGSAIRFLGD